MTSVPPGNHPYRAFAETRHQTGKWQTHIIATRNPLLRAFWNFISFKRQGIDRLARMCRKSTIVIDLGAGTGAYAHWFSGINRQATIIAIDWSFTALRRITQPKNGAIARVCADAHNLPLKPETGDALYSIDTLGHVDRPEKVLDEIARVVKCGAHLFLHSECSDYKHRWPDAMLIRKNTTDVLAEEDGHFSLHPGSSLYMWYRQRFEVTSFFSPAGILGWLIGYPEKYRKAFYRAHCHGYALITAIFSVLKKIPVTGIPLRILNACSNHAELYLGLYGGGSCFASLKKPLRKKTSYD